MKKFRIKKERVFFAMTWLRWILGFVVAIALASDRHNIALFIFLLTAFVSFLEKFIARKYPSALRSIVDIFADKILVNATMIVLAIKEIIPFWIMLVILARDMLTVIGSIVLLYKGLRKEFRPTILGRLSYFFQIMALVPVILNSEIDWYVMSAALALTVASGAYALFKSEFRFVRRKAGLEEFRLMKLVKFADLFTLLNVALGLVSITFSIENNFKYAAVLLIIAVAFDYLDGKVAQLMRQQSEFGKELDSLADTVSFGVAPAIFGFSIIQTPLAIISFAIFLFCGILRLAKYNIMELKGAFQGMPITLNGVFIPFFYLIGAPVRFYPYIYLVLGILMISSFRVKRLP